MLASIFLTTHSSPRTTLLLYSTDLALRDFHLFPKLKEHTLGTEFDADDAIMATVDELLKARKYDFS